MHSSTQQQYTPPCVPRCPSHAIQGDKARQAAFAMRVAPTRLPLSRLPTQMNPPPPPKTITPTQPTRLLVQQSDEGVVVGLHHP